MRGQRGDRTGTVGASARGRGGVLAVALAIGLLGACSSDDDGGSAADGPLQPASSTTTPTVPSVPAPSAGGSGTIVVGGIAHEFAVDACRLEPDPDEPAQARALLRVEGSGQSSRGDAFTVELTRFATTIEDTTTFTDTITFDDGARILQALRYEVAGEVNDPRDPAATSPLLRPRADGVSGAGLASAPGEGANAEGVIGVAVDATC